MSRVSSRNVVGEVYREWLPEEARQELDAAIGAAHRGHAEATAGAWLHYEAAFAVARLELDAAPREDRRRAVRAFREAVVAAGIACARAFNEAERARDAAIAEAWDRAMGTTTGR